MGKLLIIFFFFLTSCFKEPEVIDCPPSPPPPLLKCPENSDIDARKQTLEVQNRCFESLEKRESSLRDAREQITGLEDELRSTKEDLQFYRDKASSSE